MESEERPGTGIDTEAVGGGVSAIYARFAPENRALLATRDRIQAQIDVWHAGRTGTPIDQTAYQTFLREIGYLVDAPAPFAIAPGPVDDDVARIAGPQLVVPILNARFLLNAANARWGSLYDAPSGTDALPGPPAGPGHDPVRRAAV